MSLHAAPLIRFPIGLDRAVTAELEERAASWRSRAEPVSLRF